MISICKILLILYLLKNFGIIGRIINSSNKNPFHSPSPRFINTYHRHFSKLGNVSPPISMALTLNGKCWTTEAFQSPRFISRKLLQRLPGWHWRSRPVDSVGNVANVVTECHRAPSQGGGSELLGTTMAASWRGTTKGGGQGDISSLGKLERGPWCLEDEEVGYLSPVGATSRPSFQEKSKAFRKNDKFLSLTTVCLVQVFYARSCKISYTLLSIVGTDKDNCFNPSFRLSFPFLSIGSFHYIPFNMWVIICIGNLD